MSENLDEGEQLVSSPRRIGVFGGSFDPIHIGHLIIAEILKHELQLQTVLMMPAGRPPHKPEQDLAADHHRVEMLERALADAPGYEICTVDLDRPGSSYTATTLEILRDDMPDVDFYFLMGQDSLRDFPKWRDPDRIARIAQLGVALRPGVQASADDVTRAVPETTDRIHLVSVPLIGISSRDIRRRIREEMPFRFQVPCGVANYIDTHGLYMVGNSADMSRPII